MAKQQLHNILDNLIFSYIFVLRCALNTVCVDDYFSSFHSLTAGKVFSYIFKNIVTKIEPLLKLFGYFIISTFWMFYNFFIVRAFCAIFEYSQCAFIFFLRIFCFQCSLTRTVCWSFF